MAYPNSVSYDYDTINTTTMQLLRARIADTIFKNNPLTAWMLSGGRVRKENGGKWIEEPLLYSKNTTIAAYRGYDPLNVAPTEEITAARYNWRQIAGSVTMSGLEQLQNSGESAVFNMLRQKLKVLEMSFKEYMEGKLFEAASGKDPVRDILGLDEVVENVAGGSQGSLGGINKTTYSWWRNQRKLVASGTYLYGDRPLTKNMIVFMNDCSKGLTRPDLIVTTQEWYENYELENHDLLRLQTSDRNMLDVGFMNQKFKGATMMWSETCQADHMYFLNSEYLSFVIHSARNFVMTPFAKPINQDAKTAQMLFAGNLTCNNCRFQGVMDPNQITYDVATGT